MIIHFHNANAVAYCGVDAETGFLWDKFTNKIDDVTYKKCKEGAQ